MKLIPAIVLAVQATMVMAGEHEGPPPADPSAISSSTSDAHSNSYSSSSTDSYAKSGDSYSNAKSGDSSANSGGNSVSNSSVYTEVKRAVTGNSSGSNTTAGCRYDSHMGLGSVLGGLSFGRSYKDRDCLKLQVANDLWSKGLNLAAVRVYCTIPTIKDALGDDCEALLNQQPSKPVADAVTHEELNRVMKSAASK